LHNHRLRRKYLRKRKISVSSSHYYNFYLYIMAKTNIFGHLKADFPASIVVFFVALPLCLGIALASGAPLFSGLIAGIVGGIFVGAFSQSRLGVSGPAAGLAAIVAVAIIDLGGYEKFLVAVVLAGIFQVILGLLKAGIIGYYFPSSVIKGMLTGIGIIIILKQIPNFFGYDEQSAWDLEFIELDGKTTFDELLNTITHVHPGAALIGVISLLLLILWDKVLSKRAKIFQLVQGPLVVVVLGILFYVFTLDSELLSIGEAHLVNVPKPSNVPEFIAQFSLPDFSAIGHYNTWITAVTLAVVASIETLLSVEATDKLDPMKNVTPTNRELLAQGGGNIISGMIGGLPVTQVIVRSSANIQSGARTQMSAILHGFLLLLSVIVIPHLLNKIPLAVLAAILLTVGYKLSNPALFKSMFKLGWKQFVPFIVTVAGIILTDLLVGVGLGLGVGLIVIAIKSYQNSHFLHKEKTGDLIVSKMTLAEEVTFLNKGAILKELEAIPENTTLLLDASKTSYLDYDVIEIISDFLFKARNRNIRVKVASTRGDLENNSDIRKYLHSLQSSEPNKQA
jgi:MFS superfamily sulfate permease-like transporter